MPHFGEEPCISGERGSGTIFFSGCNMRCIYCQNYKFSQLNEGRRVNLVELAQIMLELQHSGCHNINLVTPTHIMPQILGSLSLAIPKGLRIPLVYNTSGYELPWVISLLDGIVDVFLADMRYADNETSMRYSNSAEYPKYNQAALKQMHKQVGIAEINKHGLIIKGLIVRHLVLPNNLAGTFEVMRFISREVSDQTYISLMSQYLPCHKADQYPELSRRITIQEYKQAKEAMFGCGLSNGWLQESRGLARLAGTRIKPAPA